MQLLKQTTDNLSSLSMTGANVSALNYPITVLTCPNKTLQALEE